MAIGKHNRKLRGLVSTPGRIAVICVLVLSLCGLSGLALHWAGRPEQRMRTAVLAVKKGDLDLAKYLALKMEGTDAGNARASLIDGAIAVRRKRLKEALKPLQSARAAEEWLPEVLSLEGETLILSGHPQEAAMALSAAIDIAPNLAEPHRFLGALCYDLGNNAEAIKYLKRAADLAPRNPGPDFLLGHLFLETGDSVRAETHFKESLRRSPLQPDRPVLLQELAQAQLAQGRPRDARETLSQCDQSSEVESLMARCHHAEGDSNAAMEHAELALRSAPQNGEMLMLVGTIALERGDADKAFDALSRAVEAYPNSEEAHRGFAETYKLLGEPQRAAEEERIADGIRDQWRQYRAMAEQAEQDPTSAEKRFELAKIARQLGEPQMAFELLKEVMQIDPNHEQAREALGLSPVGATAEETDLPQTPESNDEQPSESAPVPIPNGDGATSEEGAANAESDPDPAQPATSPGASESVDDDPPGR